MKSKYAKVWDKSHEYWAKYQNVNYDNWLINYEEVIDNAETIIDLGCGGSSASNTKYLLSRGKNVLSCDFSQTALSIVQKIDGAKTILFDMLETFPFQDNSIDVVIADLSLHYFKENDTFRVLREIKRVLKDKGYLFFRLNSTHSIEFKKLLEQNTEEIEPKLFFTRDMEKRFFDKDDINKYFYDWLLLEISEENMTRWSDHKIVWKGAVQNIKD